jgi:hypothetical protein
MLLFVILPFFEFFWKSQSNYTLQPIFAYLWTVYVIRLSYDGCSDLEDALLVYYGQSIEVNVSCDIWFKEVRVRYHGFSKDEDEWINVKDGVRQRSIPLEASECHKVKEGHLVCFLVMDSSLFYCTYININNVSGVQMNDAVFVYTSNPFCTH